MKRIAVLLTCHNRKDKTVESLRCLYKCLLPENFCYDVFLVDDGSTDGTTAAVNQNFPKVNIISGNGHLYWNRGMHLAWKTAAKHDYDFYLWLNDDTFLFRNAITEILECAALTNEKTIVCAAVQSPLTGKFTYGGRGRDDKELIPDNTLQECYKINGNCVLVPKKVFEITGNLDPAYPHAIGDYDYGLRAIKNGLTIITTRIFVGTCEEKAMLPKWCYSNVPLVKRLKNLYSPLGNSHPYYYFLFAKKHYGLSTAIRHFLSIHLRVFMPGLWHQIKSPTS